jgi:Antitoxin-like ribbon-helix-helix
MRKPARSRNEQHDREKPTRAAQTDKSVSARQGKKVIAGFFDPAVSRQLKEIGLSKNDASIQDLLREALNDLFVKYGKKPIA